MNIAYFRKSTFSLENTVENLVKNAKKESWKILGQTDLPENTGKMILVCRPEWVKSVIKSDYNLLGFLPCSISVFKKDNGVLIGTGQPAVMQAISKDPAIQKMAAQADQEIQKLINTSAGVGELKPKDVTLYSTMSCPYCKMEKDWLDKNKVKHKVIYVDLDQQEAQKLVEKTGQMGVPVTEIIFDNNESEYIIGFDQPRLSQSLGI